MGIALPAGYPTRTNPLVAGRPRMLWQVAWTSGGNDASPRQWHTITSRLRGSWSAALSGRQYELDAVQSGSAALTLDSVDGAFDPDNDLSPFWPYVTLYRPLRLVMVTHPSRSLLTAGLAGGTSTVVMAASAGTLGTVAGLGASASGLTTAQTWTIPSGTPSGAVAGQAGDVLSWSTAPSWATTVVEGQPYSAGVDVQLATGGMTALSLSLRISWYTLGGTLLGRATGTAQNAAAGSWLRLAVTGTAPTGCAFGVVSVTTGAAATAATTACLTGWQLEHGSAPTAWAATGTWQSLWSGFAQQWLQSWADGKRGLTAVTGVDALGPLSQIELDPAMPVWMGQSGPQYRWDLAAMTGTSWADLGGTGATLTPVGANYTAGVDITSTDATGTLWNTPGPVATLTNNQAASQGNAAGATYLQPAAGAAAVILPSSGGWTRMLCFRTTSTPGTGGTYTLATLWAATAAGFLSGTGDTSGNYAYITTAGQVGVNWRTTGSTDHAVTDTSIDVCDGNWHCAVWSVSADGLTARVTVDATSWQTVYTTNLHMSTCTQDAIGTLLVSGGTNTQPFSGDVAWAAQWTRELDQDEQIDIAAGFATGWAHDSTALRIERVLQLANWAMPDLDYVGTVADLGTVITNQRQALDIIQETSDSENGQLTVAGDGTPTLWGHLWRWVQGSPTVVFGEDTAAGEIPYLGDVQMTQDPARLFNDIQVTVDGALDAVTDADTLQDAKDDASQAAYFPQSVPRTVNTASITTGKSIARYLLSQLKDPHTRVPTLTVDLAPDASNRLDVLAPLAVATRVRVTRRPIEAPAKSVDSFVEGIAWSGDDTGALQVAYQLSPAGQWQYWIISAAWAKLTAPAAAGTKVITTGPISGNASIAAQYVLPAGFQLVLGFGTAAAEAVTVQSVQTVTAGYSSVQITLTAATANPHSTGDYLCSPEPGNATIPPASSWPTCYDAASAIAAADGQPLIGY